MSTFRSLTLVAATMTTGLGAGVFALYAHTVMPGLGTLDDRSFVASFQALDRAIVNPWFMATAFVGALVTGVLAVVTQLGRPALRWVVAALVLHLVVMAVTVAVHLPLNDAIKAAGDPSLLPDPAAVRAAFHEGRWVAWNLVRTVASVGSLGCLCWALVVHGGASA